MPRTAAAKKNPPAEPVQEPAKIDDALLAEIDEASQRSANEQNYHFVAQDEIGVMLNAGYVVVNPNITDGAGKVAARITNDGRQYLEQNAPGLISRSNQPQSQPETSTVENTAANTATPAENTTPRAKPVISGIATVQLAASTTRRGGARPEVYPFSKLEVGQAFFIQATDETPDPMKSYASTVASANSRYARPVEGETRTNRKGEQVPKMEFTRRFALVRVDDGAPFGPEFAGKSGVAVQRVQ